MPRSLSPQCLGGSGMIPVAPLPSWPALCWPSRSGEALRLFDGDHRPRHSPSWPVLCRPSRCGEARSFHPTGITGTSPVMTLEGTRAEQRTLPTWQQALPPVAGSRIACGILDDEHRGIELPSREAAFFGDCPSEGSSSLSASGRPALTEDLPLSPRLPLRPRSAPEDRP
jgi:hypothetical protein